jgi:hypothetical protein
MTRHMLTTTDNPFNPFLQFDSWYTYDEQAGYHTTSFLARIARTSPELSDADQDQAMEDAIEDICRENVLGLWRKVPEPSDTSDSEPSPMVLRA